jgi:hypothetical protein
MIDPELIIRNRTFLMKCDICNKTDLIHRKDGKTWTCPYCEFIDKNEEIFQKNITNHLKMYEKLDDLNSKCEDNMKRLNAMMLELKGIIAMVRPMAKKNDWYGEEILVKNEEELIFICNLGSQKD